MKAVPLTQINTGTILNLPQIVELNRRPTALLLPYPVEEVLPLREVGVVVVPFPTSRAHVQEIVQHLLSLCNSKNNKA